jgi:SAM-dependent methyltransferase
VSTPAERASLESLIEAEDLGLEVLHPGGLEITRELAELCHISQGARVLDVASGTGASAAFLAETFGCCVVGLDASDSMLERASRRSRGSKLSLEFKKGNAHNLPFEESTFDAVISECTTCLFIKVQAIREMVRVAKSGGYVGIHDLFWKASAPVRLKRRLKEIEGEDPETLEGWKGLFEAAGLADVRGLDRSQLIPAWSKITKKKLGLRGLYRTARAANRRWGLGGLLRILQSERVFTSPHTGYALIVGRKP